MKEFILLILILANTMAFGQTKTPNPMESSTVVCKLTTPELQERKKTVIAALKSQLLEKRDTESGAKFRFRGTDEMLNTLTNFIKTERLCCSFFNYTLSVGDENSDVWLELSGPEGTKDFIRTEIGL